MTEAVDDRKRQIRRDLAPLGTEGNANDIAMAAVFLASEESRWITGVLLPVDAGLMAAGPQSLINNILDDYEYR
jgi:NAD(P)-dependent dehydrogenase (short-subunit alcohol dehydrogenase family)